MHQGCKKQVTEGSRALRKLCFLLKRGAYLQRKVWFLPRAGSKFRPTYEEKTDRGTEVNEKCKLLVTEGVLEGVLGGHVPLEGDLMDPLSAFNENPRGF